MKYELLCNSVRGASHIHKDIPCEDYGMKKNGGDYKIFVTSDGHGDPNCLRSQLGSKFICEVTVSNLEKFAKAVIEENKSDELFVPKTAEYRIRHLVTCIMSDWLKKVNNNFESDPPTEEDYSKAAEYADEFKKGIRIERAYGATLIAGLQTERFLLLLQQGDGRCVVFGSDGNASQPIPWDERCVGNMTTSLCDPDAIPSFRYHVIDLKKNPVLACFAGSDGVEDSFPTSMEKTHAYYRELLEYACENGIPALEDYMSEELTRLSTMCSQDDITVTGIADLGRLEDFRDTFAKQNHYVDLVDRHSLLETKLRSIEEGGKYGHLQKKYTESVSKYEEIDNRYKNISDECTLWKSQIMVQESPDDLAAQLSCVITSDSVEETNATENIDDPKLKNTISSFFKEKIMWPSEFLAMAKKKYAALSKEKEKIESEWRMAKEALDKAAGEFIPYNKTYEDLKKQKKELEEKINEFKENESLGE